MPDGRGVLAANGRSLPPVGRRMGPALLAATQASLAALRENGHLPEDQTRLLIWLLDEAEASGKFSGGGWGGREEVNVCGGWAELPEEVATQVFGPGDGIDTGGKVKHQGMLRSARLACRSWRRAVSRHCREATVRLDLRHAVPHWTAKISQVAPAVTSLVLDLGFGRDDFHDKGSGAGAISAASGTLRSLELRNWWMSPADLKAIAGHHTGLRELRLSPGRSSRAPDNKTLEVYISKMTTLEVLELNCEPHDEWPHLKWRALGSLGRLRELCIRHVCPALKTDLPHLASRLTNLATLSLPLHMTPEILQALRPLTALRELDMPPPASLSEVVPDLAGLSSLRKCTMASPGEDDVEMFLADLSQDEEPATVAAQVQQLALFHVDLTGDNGLRTLARLLPGLAEVSLYSVSMDAAQLPWLSGLRHLTKLGVLMWFSGDAIPEPGLQGLSSLRELEMETIQKKQLGSSGLPLLLPPGLQRLQLHLGNNELFLLEEVVRALAPLSRLECVALRGLSVATGTAGEWWPGAVAAPQVLEAEMAKALPQVLTISIL